MDDRAKLDWSFVLFGYGTKWRSHRRLFHKYFGTNVVSNFEPQERKATHELLYRLIHKPEDFMSHIRLYVPFMLLEYVGSPDSLFFLYGIVR